MAMVCVGGRSFPSCVSDCGGSCWQCGLVVRWYGNPVLVARDEGATVGAVCGGGASSLGVLWYAGATTAQTRLGCALVRWCGGVGAAS